MASKATEQSKADQDLLKDVLDELGRAKAKHDARVAQYRARYRAWTGVLERENDVWESQLAPKYAFQKIDTLIANLVDRQPTGKVYPCKPGQADYAAAQAMERVLNEFRRRDRDYAGQRQHVQQACVMGISPRKNFWRYERSNKVWKQLEMPAPVLELGRPPSIPSPSLVEKQGEITRWNQPVSRVVPVEDFMWDPSASHVEDCAWQAAIYWVTPKHLKDFANAKVYDENAVRRAMETRSGRKGTDVGIGPEATDRAGRIEVVEYWERDALVTIANRTSILRKMGVPNGEGGPYWHGELPFDLATTMPDLYRVEGFSEIELIAELQAALWDFLNQRIDNTRFMSNAVTVLQEGTTMTEEGVFPGATIYTDGDPRQVQFWTPPTNIIEPSIQASQELKQDIDDVTGVTPYVSGAGSQTLDQQTATQISTFQSMAAKRLESKRTMIFQCEQDRGMQRLALTQQFLTTGVEIRGAVQNSGTPDEQYGFEQILPQQIVTAMLEYEIDETNESMDRQQRRQEALTLLTTGIQLQTLLVAPGAAPPSGEKVDLIGLWKRVLQSFDMPTEIGVTAPPSPLEVLAAMAQTPTPAGVLAGQAGVGGAGPPPPPFANGNGAAVPPLPPPGAMSAQPA